MDERIIDGTSGAPAASIIANGNVTVPLETLSIYKSSGGAGQYVPQQRLSLIGGISIIKNMM